MDGVPVNDLQRGGPRPLAEPWQAVENLVLNFRANRADGVALATHVCAETVRLIGPAAHAGVLLVGDRRHPAIVATSDEVPRRLDELQQRSDRGPCLTAARTRSVVRIDDTASESRWPVFVDAARTEGVAAMLCVPLHVDDATWGTLTVYSAEPNALVGEAEPTARVLGLLAAIALSEERKTLNLNAALLSRDLIGQAKGIIMRQHHVDAQTAFTMLSHRSQTSNVKLAELAARTVEARTFDLP